VSCCGELGEVTSSSRPESRWVIFHCCSSCHGIGDARDRGPLCGNTTSPGVQGARCTPARRTLCGSSREREFQRYSSTYPPEKAQVTRAIQDPLVLRQMQFAQDFQRRFCPAGGYVDRIPVVGAGRACQMVHTRPFLLASRRFDGWTHRNREYELKHVTNRLWYLLAFWCRQHGSRSQNNTRLGKML